MSDISHGEHLPRKPLCPDAWVIPPSPIMLKHGNDYYTCSICGEPCEVVDLLEDIANRSQAEENRTLRHVINYYLGDDYMAEHPDPEEWRAEAVRRAGEENQEVRGDLLFDLDEIDNKPWRVFRRLAELMPEYADTYRRYEAFYSYGSGQEIMKLIEAFEKTDDFKQSGFPEMIAELQAQKQGASDD